MHIGIITFHWAHNYGAVLQTYALQEVLARQGHEVEVIDYRPSWASNLKRRKFPRRPGAAINLVDHWIRKHTFTKFRKKYLNLTKRVYHYGEVIEGFDCVITGSDQVFNPDLIASGGFLDSTYLLSSVDANTRKLSYAASFGNSTLAEEYKELFHDHLSSFDEISIRENSGKDIVESLGLKAVTVPDPTILLGDFSSFVGNQTEPDDDYVLNFIFQNTNAVRMVQNVVSEESNLPIKTVRNLIMKVKGYEGLYNLSPEQWINTIHDAHFVITDSFHSTIFCILSHRPFISLVLDGWGGDWSERIKALLSRLSLQDRLLTEPTEEAVRKIYHTTIDWNEIDKKIEYWKVDGDTFTKIIENE